MPRGKGGSTDSDRPEWARGNNGANDNIKGNDESGTGRGGDYGDLYVLLRDDNGVPEMRAFEVLDEEGSPTGEIKYVVQPIGVDGAPLELDAEGALTEASLLLAQPVDFGRLNIVRSPQSVLDQAMGEALKVINAGERFTVDFCGRLTIWNTVDGVLTITKTIDLPRESMAIYQEIMNNGFSGKLIRLADSGLDPYMLAACSFAAGSDKTGTINIDEIVYINGFINCVGCDPILNEHEYDFNKDHKYYFNFGDCDCHEEFQYSRDIYRSKMLKIITLNPDGTWTEEVVSVMQAMEERGLFMYRWEGVPLTRVDGFTAAADDAVQVLEFVHGNTNIEFLPTLPTAMN